MDFVLVSAYIKVQIDLYEEIGYQENDKYIKYI